jgi:NAD(P)-dependent dehydrogenase (short-subunit alcohol dehydrogenase family)
MTGKLENRVAIITAGGSGIGAARASVYRKNLSLYRHQREARAESDCRHHGKRWQSHWLKMDASDRKECKRRLLALDTYGRLDVMFNNAGQADAAYLEDTTLESWNRVIA